MMPKSSLQWQVRAGGPQLRPVYLVRDTLPETEHRTRVTGTQFGIVVIGVGNTFRGDDGAGIFVVRQLATRVPAGARIIEESGEGAALLELWKAAASVFLVDAVESGAPPGTIHRIDANAAPLPSRFFHCSTHAFGVAGAVELARVWNILPPRLIVYGIEGRSFSAGTGLSAEVEQAGASVEQRMLDEIHTRICEA